MKNFLFLCLFISSTSFASGVFKGSYHVPVKELKMENFATHLVEGIQFSVDHLTFKLPAAIASDKALEVKFVRSVDEPNTFHSAFGIATCLQAPLKQNLVRCDIQYNAVYAQFLRESLKETEDFLSQQKFSAEELSAKTQIAQAFSGNPIGFLLISLESI